MNDIILNLVLLFIGFFFGLLFGIFAWSSYIAIEDKALRKQRIEVLAPIYSIAEGI